MKIWGIFLKFPVFIGTSRTFSVSQIKISTSEPCDPLTNDTLSYGTNLIKGIYIFAVSTAFFFFSGNKRALNGENVFSSILAFSVKQIKFIIYTWIVRDYSLKYRHLVCLHIIHFSHVLNKVTNPNTTSWKTLQNFYSNCFLLMSYIHLQSSWI